MRFARRQCRVARVCAKRLFGFWLAVTLCLIPFSGRSSGASDSGRLGRVYVFLWFDTEDYISPQSDDAAKKIAEFLTRQGIQATFKVVGEKGRVLERRKRRDVIEALSRHEIGYHSNTHSQHPTVAEYESRLDWENGVEEFNRREHPGFHDLRRIFGRVPTCYGQPGDSWAPQAYGALHKWGVKVYLDEGKHVSMNGKPFWYGGLLNIFNTVEGPELRPNDTWSNLSQAKSNFKESYQRLVSRNDGGIVSLYFHPTEFVHREFWDAVNFARGANPPPGEWKLPPARNQEEQENAFRYFEELVTYMKSFPSVRFVTASQGGTLFEDAAQKHVFTRGDISSIAGAVQPNVMFQESSDWTLSGSEVFALLTNFVDSRIRNIVVDSFQLHGTPYGPSSQPIDFDQKIDVPWDQFSRTVLDVAEHLQFRNQIPTAVWVGSTEVAPENYLVAVANVARELLLTGTTPKTVSLAPAHLGAANFVAEDSPELWDWVIFPPGFRSSQLMRIAKLQAWTLKPAMMPPR